MKVLPGSMPAVLMMGVAAAVALGVLLPLPASATTTESGYGGTTPVGTWSGTVEVDGSSSHSTTFAFASGGVACLSFGSPGEVNGSGVGTWSPAGPGRFEFHIPHDVIDPNGAVIATVDVEQAAEQSGDTFTSSGASATYDADGNPTGTATTSVSATRTSAAEPSCSR